MAKLLNTFMILLASVFGWLASASFGYDMQSKWTFIEYVSAPFVFGAMVVLGEKLSNKSPSKKPNLSDNLFSNSSSLNTSLLLGAVFIPFGTVGLISSFVEFNRFNGEFLMFLLGGAGVYLGGLLAHKITSKTET